MSNTTESVPPGITIHKDLIYSTPSQPLTLDLFLPPCSSNPVPCVIVIQGGGFRAHDGQRFRPFAEYLAEHGFAAALIAYRGKPDHTYMDTVADTKAAVRFVRKISGEYTIDPDRIGAMGRSAGGTLAALLAVTGDAPEFAGTGGHPEYSSRIQTAVCYAGVFDFIARFTNAQQIALQPNADTKIVANGEWIGVPFAADNEHWLRASAINHVNAGDSPIYFMHCKDDSTVPWLQSQEMHERMKAAGIASELKYFEEGGHGFQLEDKEAPLREMVEFFRRKLR